MTYIFIGIASGASVLLARAIGAQDSEKIKRLVDTAVVFAFFAGIGVAVFGWIMAPHIMTWVNCPPECYSGASLYLRIYLAAAPAVLLQNFCCTMLNTSGNTRSPLAFMLIGGALKIVLNIALCFIFPNKVLAVSLATACSQILWAVLAIRRLQSGADKVQINLRELKFDLHTLGQILKLGLPISLYKALYPLSNLQIQTAVNSFGAAVVAGNSAAAALEGIVNAFSVNLGTCASVFVGQNLGAENPPRVWKSFWSCIGVSLVVVNSLAILIYSTGRFWLGLLIPDSPEAIEASMIRMTYMLLFYGISGLSSVLGQTVQSFGYSFITSLNSVVFVLLFRVAWMAWVYPRYQTYRSLVVCFLVSWILVLITNAIMATVILLRYRKGKYKKL